MAERHVEVREALGRLEVACCACCSGGATQSPCHMAEECTDLGDVRITLAYIAELESDARRYFPTAARFTSGSIAGQSLAVESEANELLRAVGHGEEAGRLAEETWDVIHAAETMLSMLEREGADIEAVRWQVQAKNRKRGYYEPGDAS